MLEFPFGFRGPLVEPLGRLRTRVRRLLWASGLSWVGIALVGTLFVAGMLDWLIRLDDGGVRLILALAVCGTTGWIAWMRLIRPLATRLENIDLALRIERRYPAFADALASAVQFADAPHDSRVGSPALQERVIREALARYRECNFDDVLEVRPVRRSVFAALAVLLFVGLVAGFHRAEAATILARLIFPFSDVPWPRATVLQFVTADGRPFVAGEKPLRIARGDLLELFVINRNSNGRLPERALLEMEYADRSVAGEALHPATVRLESGRLVPAFPASFMPRVDLKFRAVGGDDATSWYSVEVVPPPAIQSLKVRLTPPAYTKKPPLDLPDGVGHIEALQGTAVSLEVRSSRPLGAARVLVKDAPVGTTAILDDRLEVHGEFTLADSGSYTYWIDLTDQEGFGNRDAPRFEVRAIADEVPFAAIQRPATDVRVTPQAVLALEAFARDDLGLRRFSLHRTQTPGAVASAEMLFDGTDGPLQLTRVLEWNVAEAGLKPGQTVVLHLEATDAYDLGALHVGRSLPRTVTVVSEAEKLQELADRQSTLLQQLDRVHKLQRDAAGLVRQLQIQAEQAGTLQPQDVDLLQSVEAQQRQIATDLQHPGQGIEAQARALLGELHENRIPPGEIARQLEEITSRLGELGADVLPQIEDRLATLRKKTLSGGAASDPAKRGDDAAVPAADFDPVREKQEAVESTLGDLLERMRAWNNARELGRDLDELIAGQQQINAATAELGQETLTRPRSELTPQQQADLARLADRQRQHADRAEQFESRLQRALTPTGGNAPQSPPDPNLQDLAQTLQAAKVDEQMREAARQIGDNRVGQASVSQQQAVERLQEARDLLSKKSPADDLETLVKKLEAAGQRAEELQQQQQELMQEAQEARNAPAPEQREEPLRNLEPRQEELRQQAAMLQRALERLRQESARTAQRAAQRMQQAARQLDEDPDAALTEQQQAIEDLEQLRNEIAEERNEAAERLAFELLEKIGDELKSMIAREQTVIDETARLQQLREERGSLTRAQLRSLRDLAEAQAGLHKETEALVARLEPAPVFAVALRGAGRQMKFAAERLDERDTGAETQKRETAARQRLVDLIAALEARPKPPEENAPPPEPPAGEPPMPPPMPNGPPGDRIPPLAELRMLRTLQADLLRRTEELDARAAAGELTPADQRELEELAVEQEELADLARNMAERAAASPPAAPDGAPADKARPEEGAPPGAAGACGDPPPTTDPQPDEKKKPNAVDGLSDEVQRALGLEGAEAAQATAEKILAEAIAEMRAAGGRMAEKDAGATTQRAQRIALEKLDLLIKALENPPPQPPSAPRPPPMGQTQQPQDRNNTGGMPPPQPTNSGERPPGSRPMPGTDGAGGMPRPRPMENSDAADAAERQEPAGPKTGGVPPPPERIEKEVWGHLPPGVRQQLRNIYSEKFLPKYEDLVRQYYEALAERNEAGAGR